MTTVAFFGTPAAAVPSLAAIAEVADVAFVCTQPDRPQGRSKALVAPPVKVAAAQWGFRVEQPEKPGELLDELFDVDVAVVVAYGALIPEAMLIAPRRGFINLHFSLLPRWRGAAPVARAILAGDEHTGVSLMQLDAGMDTGPVFASWTTEVRPNDTTGVLTARLAGVGAALLASQLDEYAQAEIQLMDQIEEYATIAGKVKTSEARLSTDRETVLAQVRAFNPSPGAFLEVEGERIKVWRATPAPVEVPVGSLDASSGTALLGLDGGTVELLDVQPAGKRRMSGTDWVRGVTWGTAPVDHPQ